MLAAMFVPLALGSAYVHALDLTIDPTEPSCEDPITFHVHGDFPDLCWSVTHIDFVVDGTNLGFIIYAVDSWEPGLNCSDAIYHYSSTETVDPLPTGSYMAFAREEVISLRIPEGDSVAFPFMACCEEPPMPVTDLVLEKIWLGRYVRFTWTDTTDAETYDLYRDVLPQGSFDWHVGTTTTGVTGIDLPLTSETTFYLLSTTNVCGEGPLH
jgi:hypothetical protein